MNVLTKNEILSQSDRAIEMVEAPEWGGVVFVRSLSGEERDQFEASIVERNGRDVRTNLRNLRARLVVLAACDESGKPIFAPGDADALGAKNAAVLDRIFSVAQRLSGLRENDVQELAENFGATRGEN